MSQEQPGPDAPSAPPARGGPGPTLRLALWIGLRGPWSQRVRWLTLVLANATLTALLLAATVGALDLVPGLSAQARTAGVLLLLLAATATGMCCAGLARLAATGRQPLLTALRLAGATPRQLARTLGSDTTLAALVGPLAAGGAVAYWWRTPSAGPLPVTVDPSAPAVLAVLAGTVGLTALGAVALARAAVAGQLRDLAPSRSTRRRAYGVLGAVLAGLAPVTAALAGLLPADWVFWLGGNGWLLAAVLGGCGVAVGGRSLLARIGGRWGTRWRRAESLLVGAWLRQPAHRPGRWLGPQVLLVTVAVAAAPVGWPEPGTGWRPDWLALLAGLTAGQLALALFRIGLLRGQTPALRSLVVNGVRRARLAGAIAAVDAVTVPALLLPAAGLGALVALVTSVSDGAPVPGDLLVVRLLAVVGLVAAAAALSVAALFCAVYRMAAPLPRQARPRRRLVTAQSGVAAAS